jgi:uncharacterized protein YkvS
MKDIKVSYTVGDEIKQLRIESKQVVWIKQFQVIGSLSLKKKFFTS